MCPQLVARRAGSRRGRARVGGSAAAARGLRLRGRARGAGSRLLRDEGRRAAVRRPGGGARAGARLRRNCLGPTRGRCAAPVRRPRGGERRASRAGTGRLGREGGGVPRAAAALAPAAPGRPLRGARRARRAQLGGARGAAGGSGRGAARPGGTAGVGARARRREAPACAAGGRRPSSSEALEFPEAVGNELTLRRAFGSLLDRLLARPERAGRPFRKVALSARLVGGGSWRRTVTLRDPTADRPRLRAALGPKLLEIPAPVLELRLEAVELSESVGRAARARQARGRRGECTPERRVAPGARQHRLRLRRRRRGGGAVVADSRSTSAVRSAGRVTVLSAMIRVRPRTWPFRPSPAARAGRSPCGVSVADTTGSGPGQVRRGRVPRAELAAGRINAPRPALVEASPVGVPVRVNREGVALVREEWRVVDRWWTEDPLDRRYFDVVLESGQNACVFRDEEAGCWFSQRA